MNAPPCRARTGESLLRVREAGTATRLADGLACALFVLVPLLVLPAVPERFAVPKWWVLVCLGTAWFLAELWRVPTPRLPRLLGAGWTGVLTLGLATWTVAGGLRLGVTWALAPLLDRLAFLLLTLAACWRFRRSGDLSAWGVATGLGLAANLVVGSAQLLGRQPLAALAEAGDRHSAFFGNANLAAQHVGFAVLLLLAATAHGDRRVRFACDGLVAASLAWLYFLSCRSVGLALGGSLVWLAGTGAVSARRLGLLIAAGATIVLATLTVGPSDLRHPLAAEVAAEKSLSSAWRRAVLDGTLSLVRDHPWGVGAGQFAHAFVPYQGGLLVLPREAILFETPHNEYLRLAAELGVPGVFAASGILAGMAVGLRARAREQGRVDDAGSWLGAGGVFLLVESAFQFPFATASGALLAALVLGGALAAAERPAPRPRGRAWPARIAGGLVGGTALALVVPLVVSERLTARQPTRRQSLELACDLAPRNLAACLTAAWLAVGEGDPGAARRRLGALLERSPSYFPALRLLGEEALASAERAEGCRHLRRYDALFRNGSSLHDQIELDCVGIADRAVERP